MLAEAIDDVAVEESPAPTMFERSMTSMDFKDTGLTLEELPDPTLWRVLILPRQPKKMSAGGIALVTESQDAEMHLNYIGQVIKLGPLAGKSEKFQNPDWKPALSVPRYLWDVKVGDWVVFGRYSGQVITYRGFRFLTVNDDGITNVIARNPELYKVWI